MNFLRSEPGEEPVLVEGLLPGSPSRIFAAWTTPEELTRWFGLKENGMISAEVDLRVGGAWCFEMRSDSSSRQFLEGEYLEVSPPERLVFSWRHVVWPPEGEPQPSPVSRVELSFEPQGAATRLRLRHEAIDQEPTRLGVGAGWNASMARLARVLSEGKN